MGHPQVHATQDLYNTLPAWEALRQESAAPTTGSKRQHEYVDEFFTDMKKRRLTPSYDHREQSPIVIYAPCSHIARYDPTSEQLVLSV